MSPTTTTRAMIQVALNAAPVSSVVVVVLST
jgi:hypothetical protein